MTFLMEIYSEMDGWKEHGRYNSAKEMFDAWLALYDDTADMEIDSVDFRLIDEQYNKPIVLYHCGRKFTGWGERGNHSHPIKTRM